MGGLTISVYVGARSTVTPPADGAVIQIFYPRVERPDVIAVEPRGEEWIARAVQGEMPTGFPRETFAEACEDAMAFVGEEIERWR